MKLTPVLLVESIEKSLPFWTGRMGWQTTVALPDGDTLGFVILAREQAELMLQTFASARKDAPGVAGSPATHKSSLFIEVDDWGDILSRLKGYDIALPERDTFYGMREVGVIEPNGHFVMFAIAHTKLLPAGQEAADHAAK